MNKAKTLTAVRDILKGIFRHMNIEGEMKKYHIWECWEDAVGQTIAKKAQPEGIRNDVVFVKVESSVWMQELSFMKDVILDKLNERLSGAKLKDIRFKIGRLPQTCYEPEDSIPPLENTEAEHIEKITSCVNNTEIRESLQRLFAISLRKKRRHSP